MKKSLSFFLLFFALNTFSQKEANFWFFGENAGLDFSSGNPIAISDGRLNTEEGCSSISNANGELLFYSDGTILYNKNHQKMSFSDGTLADNLGGNPSSTQSALFVPNPVNENIYYLFTVGTDFANSIEESNPGFNFYTITIDPAVNSGLGEITDGPVNLAINPADKTDLSFNWSEKVTAVQGDCNSIWILSIVENKIYAYKISATGVDFKNPKISTLDYTPRDKRGYLKVSPDGKKIALADFTLFRSFFGNGRLVLFDFNDQTGEVSSNGLILTNPTSDGVPYGVEFSQQSNKLYTSTYDGNNKIFQFDLTKPDIAATKSLITSQTGYRSALQLAPNGKIYNSIPDNNFLGAIENPNDAAREVRYTKNSVSLGSRIATQGLPPFIQSFFSPVNIVDSSDRTIKLSDKKQLLCIDETITIEPEIEEPTGITFQYFWTKENDASVNFRTRSITIDKTNFGSGTYNLEVLATICGKDKKYNSSIEIEFVAKPVVNTIPVYQQCDYDTNSIDGFTYFNLASKETELSGNATNVIVDFFEDDGTLITNKVEYINRDAANATPHILKVKITNNNTGCFEIGTIALKVTPTTGSFSSFSNIYQSEINKSTSPLIISKGSNDAVFNFDKKIDDIILASGNVFNRKDHQFSFYLTANDAAKETKKIEPPYNTYHFTTNTDIFVRISKNNTCEGIGQFKLIVLKMPEPMGNTDILPLCVKFPVNTPILEEKPLDANTGNPADTYQWYLNDNLIPGETSRVLNAKKGGTYKVIANRFYQNETGAKDDVTTTGYNTFTVKESSVATIESVEFLDDQDDPASNTITIKVAGKGDYEFALNSNNPSDFVKGNNNLSYTFTNVPPGLNKVFINDRNNCGILSTKEVSFVYFQRHFTPNGDDILDTWKIQGINNTFYNEIKLQIFDRYGRLLKNINQKTQNGWDGTLNGKLLPPNDYWYSAILIDTNGNVRKKTGHFSLLNK